MSSSDVTTAVGRTMEPASRPTQLVASDHPMPAPATGLGSPTSMLVGSISFGLALVTGKNLVPRPATGKTTAFTGCVMHKA